MHVFLFQTWDKRQLARIQTHRITGIDGGFYRIVRSLHLSDLQIANSTRNPSALYGELAVSEAKARKSQPRCMWGLHPRGIHDITTESHSIEHSGQTAVRLHASSTITPPSPLRRRPRLPSKPTSSADGFRAQAWLRDPLSVVLRRLKQS